MIIDWFDAREAVQFGISLAEFLAQRVSLDVDAAKHHKSATKQKEVFPKLLLQIARFKQEHTLNMYKKAKLGNSFKWKLLDLGYEPAFVDAMTKELLVNL